MGLQFNHQGNGNWGDLISGGGVQTQSHSHQSGHQAPQQVVAAQKQPVQKVPKK